MCLGGGSVDNLIGVAGEDKTLLPHYPSTHASVTRLSAIIKCDQI